MDPHFVSHFVSHVDQTSNNGESLACLCSNMGGDIQDKLRSADMIG